MFAKMLAAVTFIARVILSLFAQGGCANVQAVGGDSWV